MNEIYIKTLKSHLDHWKHMYAEHICEEKEGRETIEALQAAIKAMETEITWIVGNDNAQIAVRNMPVDKLQKICAIIGDELEPCEDCISRQAVLDVLNRHWLNGMVAHRIIEEIGEDIKNLPSVQPKQRTGKWIKKMVRGSEELYCSNCGNGIDVIYEYNYCPNCGAKMEEGE